MALSKNKNLNIFLYIVIGALFCFGMYRIYLLPERVKSFVAEKKNARDVHVEEKLEFLKCDGKNSTAFLYKATSISDGSAIDGTVCCNKGFLGLGESCQFK